MFRFNNIETVKLRPSTKLFKHSRIFDAIFEEQEQKE